MPKEKEVKGRKWDDYKPVKNPLNKNASFDGCLVETYDPEFDLIRKQCEKDPTKVWTIVDAEGHLYTVAGFHFVNRIGYIITQVSWETESVQFDEDDRRISN